jgi:carbon storage regulator
LRFFKLAQQCCYCYYPENAACHKKLSKYIVAVGRLPAYHYQGGSGFAFHPPGARRKCESRQQPTGKAMLVLSRKVGERILIGENISVTVVRINGNAVRIGVQAPSDLTVIRQELQDNLDTAESDDPKVSQPSSR